jgi:aminopeptidase N/puromycin-sensitive aminopeptidase
MAISNGRVVSDTPGPGAGRHTVTFSTSPKMSSYLVALAVGDFECLEAAADGTPIRVCTLPGKKALGRIALESAQELGPTITDVEVRRTRNIKGNTACKTISSSVRS